MDKQVFPLEYARDLYHARYHIPKDKKNFFKNIQRNGRFMPVQACILLRYLYILHNDNSRCHILVGISSGKSTGLQTAELQCYQTGFSE